ncbi:Gfo/Idh/MocA family oxidoreductase [Luteolibacter yonseiensis]|uniref:Gfo/Idh/MocA family oxidoreductase n=1 Tax=Luteolibacter yonseiensis TaxID=1144680 RepID=A0A934R5S7_9BACT|nr:Gfo/Idh/MocA family oxidoreductase [Luteolibacter yonseiensis]MBK1816902.1 Gfo/Idh/MocA family oxidoreductase [Luteolibacter yonseiensis]
MNFGIIGTGSIGRFHAEAIRAMDGGTLHSVFQRNPQNAADYGVRSYSDLAEFLSDPELEIVTIATPSGAHFEPALAALAAGKHVVCEKPLEITAARIDEMSAAAKNAGRTLAAILNRRFNPAMSAFKAAADAGRFGKITSASCYVKWFRDQAYYDSAEWRGTWELDGGGALMNQAIHSIDALLHLAGPVKSVRANTACLAHERIEVEDMAVALLEFENGARGVIEGSTCSWSKAGHPARVQICGTEGSVFLADETFEAWDFKHGQPHDEEIRATLMRGNQAALGGNDPKAIQFHQHQRNFEEVVNAIREGREPSTSAGEARKAVELIEAIYASAAAGGEVRFLT